MREIIHDAVEAELKRVHADKEKPLHFWSGYVERMTRLELATLTLAR